MNDFDPPKDLEYKFRFFKVETDVGWFKVTARGAAELTALIRGLARRNQILGIYRSLGRFVSPKHVDRNRHFVMIDYEPVLDFDVHEEIAALNGYPEQNELLRSILSQKTSALKRKGYAPKRIVFSGGGFHFYLDSTTTDARNLARKIGADSVFEPKRVIRLENSLNVRYGDLRLCKSVEGSFDLAQHVLDRTEA